MFARRSEAQGGQAAGYTYAKLLHRIDDTVDCKLMIPKISILMRGEAMLLSESQLHDIPKALR